MRAAIEAQSFESPKLSATAVFPAGEEFATRLEQGDRAIGSGAEAHRGEPDRALTRSVKRKAYLPRWWATGEHPYV